MVPTTEQSSTTNNPNVNPQDKLRNGPCSEIYSQLEQCAINNGVDVSSHKEKLRACPSDTDRLIKCMNRNPKHFY